MLLLLLHGRWSSLIVLKTSRIWSLQLGGLLLLLRCLVVLGLLWWSLLLLLGGRIHIVWIFAWVVGLRLRWCHTADLLSDLVLHRKQLLPHLDSQCHSFLSWQHRPGVLLEVLSDVQEDVPFKTFDLQALFET